MRAASLTILGLALALPLLGGCSGTSLPRAGTYPAATPPARPTARAIALQAASVLIPYHDPWHTFELGRPQTWVALDARSNPELARALGDGVRFFEPITASDPDAGSSGKLWIDVLPVQKGRTPRQVLLAPFVGADYPPTLLRRMRLVSARLGGVAGYRLVTLASKTQVTLLLVRRHGYDYRVTVFGAIIPLEVRRALNTWRFVGPSP
ncbi:MAG TPA: hypothetical protein VFE42_33820 [Chloroflexota bacterium]|nr:hypothetical protein [Chloroflexota bacterium]